MERNPEHSPLRRIISGPTSAKILLLGEAPGEQEDKSGLPFVGASGNELTKILAEGGLNREECRIANVCNKRPFKNDIRSFMPDKKKDAVALGCKLFRGEWVTQEIPDGLDQLGATVSEMPNLELVIPLGNVSLWAITNEWGITKWRGSQMEIDLQKYLPIPQSRPVRVVPTLHPTGIMRQWHTRWYAVEDIKRALDWKKDKYVTPDYQFLIRPSYPAVILFLDEIRQRMDTLGAGERLKIAADLETRLGHVACLGLAINDRVAICIPLLIGSGSYWTVNEEIAIMWRVLTLLQDPRVFVIGQNWLYDRQYLARRYGFDIRAAADTMVMQHVCFPGIPKGLDFLSSIYNKFHCYWKDESKDWDPSVGEAQLWTYNCKDAVATWEADLRISQFVAQLKFGPLVAEQMENCDIAFRAMLRGVRVDLAYREKLATHDDLEDKAGRPLDKGIIAVQMHELKALLREFLGVPTFQPGSHPQVHWLCYQIMKLPEIKKPGGHLTADKDAIAEWLRMCEPLYRPLLQMIADFRSLQVFRSTFARAPLDTDNRFRCSINVAGPETFRYSTSSDAFGFGTNMQNLPSGDD